MGPSSISRATALPPCATSRGHIDWSRSHCGRRLLAFVGLDALPVVHTYLLISSPGPQPTEHCPSWSCREGRDSPRASWAARGSRGESTAASRCGWGDMVGLGHRLAARWRHRQTRDEEMSRIRDGDKLAQGEVVQNPPHSSTVCSSPAQPSPGHFRSSQVKSDQTKDKVESLLCAAAELC